MVLQFPQKATLAQPNSQNMSLTEQLSHSTVRIECSSPDGDGVGTGFLFQYNLDGGNSKRVLVTNKHVVKDATEGKMLFTTQGISGKPRYTNHFVCSIDDFEQKFIMHPEAK